MLGSKKVDKKSVSIEYPIDSELLSSHAKADLSWKRLVNKSNNKTKKSFLKTKAEPLIFILIVKVY